MLKNVPITLTLLLYNRANYITVRIFFCFQQIRLVRIHTPAIITSHTALCQVNMQNNSLTGIYIIDVTLTLSQSGIKIFRIVAKCTYAEWLQTEIKRWGDVIAQAKIPKQ